LGGSAKLTWRAADPSLPDDGGWPAWLAEDCPRWRIWLADVPTAVSPWLGSAFTCDDAARNLRMRLHVAKLGDRPIVWIGHSLGGLLIKALLLQAERQGLARSTRGVVFLGTPHWGSWWANGSIWLTTACRWLKWLRCSPVIGELQADAAGLRELHGRYRRLATSCGWQHRNFVEQATRWGWSVVQPSSADLGLGDAEAIPIAADHWQLCKPTSRASLVYRATVDFLDQLAA
jgi:pimeloyl-ACP methyl ester carboxylesterase